MSFTDFFEKELLDHALGGNTAGSAYTPPATVYVGLSTTSPSEDGTGITEPVGNGYARVAVSNTDTEWPAASGSPSSKSNANAIAFAAASGSGWGTISHFFIADDPTAGNVLMTGALSTSKTVGSGDTLTFGAGDLTVTLD